MAIPGCSGAQEEAVTNLQDTGHLIRRGRPMHDICQPCDWGATVVRTSGAAVTAPAVALELTSPTHWATQALGRNSLLSRFLLLPGSDSLTGWTDEQVKYPPMNWQLRERKNFNPATQINQKP